MKRTGPSSRKLMDTPPHKVMLMHQLERRVAEAPDAVFFTLGDVSQTFSEFYAMVHRVARNLGNMDIGQGTNVAVIMDTSLEYMWLWFALAKVGAVEVPINTAYRDDLLAHVLRTCAASVCIVDSAYLATVLDVAERTPEMGRIIVKGECHNDLAKSLELRDFFDVLQDPSEAAPQFPAVHYADIGGIIFTSGTTGPSKGVLLSHHYLTAYGFMYSEINSLGANDVIYNYLPFFHIGAKFLTIATLVCGGQMRLAPRLSISGFWDEVRAYGVTNFVAVGGICNMLLARPAQHDDAQTTIRTVYAVPDPADIHEEFERRFDCKMTTVYGSTEVGLPLFRGVSDAYRPGSCGRVSPYYDVEVVDAFDQPVPLGETGEIVIRPRRPYLVGSGYVGMPERTVAAWRNLWLHSGDRGAVDGDGWFFFKDRATDYIRRRGENISSFEVEALIGRHSAVAEVAAVPVASDIGEDEVWVLVTLRDGHNVTHEELLLHCNACMPYFMIPRFIDIVDSFPRTPTAKIEKYKIREAGPGPQTWDRDANGWRLTRAGVVAR